MSTNKTPNLNLHSWTKYDPIQLSEFNENFSAIDTALSKSMQMVIGTYTGNGKSNRTIVLGFQPALVILIGTTYSSNSYFSTVSLVGSDFAHYIRYYCGATDAIRTTSMGFCIYDYNYHNLSTYAERYIAFKA